MAFWLERFKKDGEEVIWEELKQMLINPPSEQEIALKKQQEQAWIDSILNKAFPENPNPQTEQPLRTNNSSMLPMSKSNQNTPEGFGQNSIYGITNKKKNEYPDLGKVPDVKNQSPMSIFDNEGKGYDNNGVLIGGAAGINKSLNQNQCNNDTFFENERKKKSSIMMKINGKLNSERPDAKLLMDIALIKPKNVPSCNDYRFISSQKTKYLNEKYKLQGNKKIDSWYDGFEFSKEAPTTQRLNASAEFKKQILDSKNFDLKNKCFKSDKLEIEFKNDKNLQYSFGHMTLIEPKITKDGYIEGIGFDKYNYDFHYNNYKKDKDIPQDIKTILLNDSATSLQKLQHLKNYFILVPVRIKLEEDDLL